MIGVIHTGIAFLVFVALYFVVRRRVRRKLAAESVILVRKRVIDTKCLWCGEQSNGMPLCEKCAGPPA